VGRIRAKHSTREKIVPSPLPRLASTHSRCLSSGVLITSRCEAHAIAKAAHAIVPGEKIQNYLLNLAHPIGGGKARFFLHFGFHAEKWQLLADAVRNTHRTIPSLSLFLTRTV